MLILLLVLSTGAWRLHKSRSYQLFGDLVTRVETSDSLVALTFDDGPTAHTDSVLSVLGARGARATFFTVGEAIERYPEAAERIVERGHELGNHSYSHRHLLLRRPAFIRTELVVTDSLIRAAGQRGPIPFRPPYGKRFIVLPWVLSQDDRPVVLADIEPDSYPEVRQSPERIVDFVMERVRPGSIVLLHVEIDARAVERASLGMLIDSLQARGYRVGTLRELMAAQDRAPL